MNIVTSFIRDNIVAFPALFGNRTRVLHYVLCVVGNGYAWNPQGEIEYVARPVEPWSYDSYLAGFKTAFEDLPQEVYVGAMSDVLKKANELQEIVDNADILAITPGRLDMEFYPQSQCSLLMNIPGNVHPDWLTACNEFKVLADAAGWDFSSPLNESEDCELFEA